jgi:hypothetical protein
MSAVITVLAEYRAKKQVKEQLARGVKVSEVTARGIQILSRLWHNNIGAGRPQHAACCAQGARQRYRV